MAKLEKKIFLEKNDDLNKAVDLLVSDSADKIILNIPKSSVLGLSIHNFQVLERESETAGKELAIESVDERVLELASLATIPSVNPVFKTKEKVVADVLPPESGEEMKPSKKTRTKTKKTEGVGKEKSKKAKGRKKKEEEESGVRESIEIMEDIVPKRESDAREPEEIVEYVPDPKVEKKMERKSKRGAKFWAIAFSTPIVIVGVVYFAVADVLPKVTVNLSIRKTTVSFSDAVIVDVKNNVPSFDGGALNLPGQLTVAKSNLSMNFPATGSSTVSTKARGTMTIHNDYSQNQILIATTRFTSPDGKVFRLVKQVSIPKGKSVDAEVMADQVGSDYNVPPAQNWQIPGFVGKAQYGKIYGESKISMTGGSSGNQIVPTQEDIRQAKEKIETSLSDALKSQTLILGSQNLKLLENASSFNVTSENIGSQVDKDGNFSIFAAGELKQMVFDESMLRDAIIKSIATSTSEVKIDDFSMSYSTSTADLALGKMSFSVEGALVYEPKIDFDAFKNEILGLDADSLKAKIFALPELERANVSFWPFWVNSVPKRGARVNILVE